MTLSSHDDDQLAEARLRVECHTDAQADVLIERVKLLGAWPDDFSIEREPFELPGGWVLVVAGVKKGRPHAMGIAPDGGVAT